MNLVEKRKQQEKNDYENGYLEAQETWGQGPKYEWTWERLGKESLAFKRGFLDGTQYEEDQVL